MKKVLIFLSLLACIVGVAPVSAATVPTKTTVKKVAVAKKVVVKKKVKKVTVSSAKNPVFSPAAAALAMGNVPGGDAYQAALRKAEKDCIAAHGNKEKLAICDQEFKDAQALLGQ